MIAERESLKVTGDKSVGVIRNSDRYLNDKNIKSKIKLTFFIIKRMIIDRLRFSFKDIVKYCQE